MLEDPPDTEDTLAIDEELSVAELAEIVETPSVAYTVSMEEFSVTKELSAEETLSVATLPEMGEDPDIVTPSVEA